MHLSWFIYFWIWCFHALVTAVDLLAIFIWHIAINAPLVSKIWIVFWFITGASATAVQHDPFPDITFATLADFVTTNFSSDISLSSVLIVMFSLLENPDLLNLHARQQIAKVDGENAQKISGWMKCLVRALNNRLRSESSNLLLTAEKKMSADNIIYCVGNKLDQMRKLLNLNPFNQYGKLQKKIKSVDLDYVK